MLDTVRRMVNDIYQIMDKRFSSYNISSDKRWFNTIFVSDTFRRAHYEVVNELEDHDTYLIHMCIFPCVDDPSPIFGIDIVYNAGKVIGAFHDFSPIGASNLNDYFNESVRDLKIENKRHLPVWAKNIFSEDIISTGDITNVEEMKNIANVVIKNLRYYLNNVGEVSEDSSFIEEQNNYCAFQKKNPHVKNTLLKFDYEEDVIDEFINTELFPEIL